MIALISKLIPPMVLRPLRIRFNQWEPKRFDNFRLSHTLLKHVTAAMMHKEPNTPNGWEKKSLTASRHYKMNLIISVVFYLISITNQNFA